MSEREDARRAALLRLLEDWEAGRMTRMYRYRDIRWILSRPTLHAVTVINGRHYVVLTPRGLAAARAIKERGE